MITDNFASALIAALITYVVCYTERNRLRKYAADCQRQLDAAHELNLDLRAEIKRLREALAQSSIQCGEQLAKRLNAEREAKHSRKMLRAVILECATLRAELQEIQVASRNDGE